MSQPPILRRDPRQLTRLEVVDIYLLIKSTHPVLLPPKSEPCKQEK
jgi:hypothetical protein